MPIKFWVWIIPISPSFFSFSLTCHNSYPFFLLLPAPFLSQSLPTVSFLGWTCCWWKLGLDANELLILSAVSPCPPPMGVRPASFTMASFLMECLGWWTTACMPTLTSSSSHTSLISVLIRPGTAHSLPNHLWAGPFPAIHFSNVEKCNSRVFSWRGYFRACRGNISLSHV